MRIFISYAAEQEPLAAELHSVLRQAGHRAFFANADLRGAEDYTSVIRAEIGRAKLFVFVISPESTAAGTYALTELDMAERQQLDILPIMAVPVPLGQLPVTLRARTILVPKGNLVAETADRIHGLRRPAVRLRTALGILALVAASVLAGPRLYRAWFGTGTGDAAATITLHQDGFRPYAGAGFDEPERPAAPTPDLSVAVRNDYDGSGGDTPHAPPALTLSYGYERQADSIRITPRMPYLSMLERGGPVQGISFWWSAFQWQYPQLSMKLVNRSDETVFFTEIAVTVNASEVDVEPVPIIVDNPYDVGFFRILNEGWGQLVDPSVELGIAHIDDYDAQAALVGPKNVVQLDSFADISTVPVEEHLPADLRGERRVTAFGILRYSTETGHTRSIGFKTRVSLVPPGPGAPAPPNYTYDLFLEAGKSGYTELVPIAQEVAAGGVDHFLLRVATDKSARFDLEFAFRTASGSEIAGESVELNIFVPRTQSEYP